MKDKAKICRRIAVTALVLAVISIAISAGRIALAQDEELTLGGLAEQIAALVARVDAIESLVAEPWSPDVVQTDDGICQSPLHTSDSFILRGEVRQETADAYRAAYGISINPTDVYLRAISFGVEGSNVYLRYEKDGKIVVETWANCEYLGHSDWEDE